jgi:flagellar biosynthesis protein FlhB
MSSTEPKTEPASAKKKREALRDGNRPKSALVATTVATLMWMLTGYLAWNIMVGLMWPVAENSMNWNIFDTRDGISNALSLWTITIILVALAAFGIELLAVAISVGLTHGQLAPAFDSLKPKFEKFNPATNAQNMFSIKQLYQLLKNVLYVLVLGWVTWLVAKHYVGATLSLYRSSNHAIQTAAPYAIVLAFTVGLGVTAALALADRTIEKILWLKELRMTKSEVKREHEEQNGNPHIKAERMASARQAASAARSDAQKYGNLVAYSASESKIVVMHTNESFKRPLVIWREKGPEADKLAEELAAVGAETIDSAYLVNTIYPRAPNGDFLNGALTEILNQHRNV